MKKSRLLLLGLLVGTIVLVVLGGCSVPERTPSLDEKAQEIYRSLMCPLCPGQTIEQSQSELSTQMRAVVREKLEQGWTKEQIMQFFVERYGEAVLAAPAKSGFNLIAWLAPIAGIVVGGVVLWLVIRKWARGRKGPSSELAIPTPNDAGDEKYRRQLEKELKDFGERGITSGDGHRGRRHQATVSRQTASRKTYRTAGRQKGAAKSGKPGRVALGIGLVLIIGLVAGFLVLRDKDGSTGRPRPLTVLHTADYHSLVFSPDDARVVFFGHHDGIMRSDDGGKTWQRLISRRDFDAMSLVIDRRDSRLIYLAGHDIFQVSRDGGGTWSSVQHNLPGTDIHGLTASPEDPGRLLAFVVGHGLFRSGDGGHTWTSLTTQLPTDVVSLAASGGNPETLYAASIRSGVLRSTNGGQAFSPAGRGLGSGAVMAVAARPGAPNTVYAGGTTGLYRSTDGGASWTRLAFPGSDIAAMAISPAQPDVLLLINVAGGAGQVYRSEDGGTTWGK